MNQELHNFLNSLKPEDLIHLVSIGPTIIGKFSKVENYVVVLNMASVSGERLAGETRVDIEKIIAWGLGGKYN